MSTASKVWLITGCSSGLGRELALAALARGDRVIATARNANKLDDLKQRGAAAVSLDVTSPDHVLQQIIADAVSVYGRIDILVNNAGYVLQGAVEECRLVQSFALSGRYYVIYPLLILCMHIVQARFMISSTPTCLVSQT
jgi:NAD(P)-dependent dehydrogenase (short-subunit alcohol dehydrogenase family)